ncbi:MAG: hypothetical protein IPG67_06000 [Acidobacteria bacterium]|nr:hypothetical protein [Acidobacteriota bacterium]
MKSRNRGYLSSCLQNGIVRVEDVINAIREETILISIMTANNEIGTLQPVEERSAGVFAS